MVKGINYFIGGFVKYATHQCLKTKNKVKPKKNSTYRDLSNVQALQLCLHPNVSEIEVLHRNLNKTRFPGNM